MVRKFSDFFYLCAGKNYCRMHSSKKIKSFVSSLKHNESTGGILLLICAVIAVTLASIPECSWFTAFWDTEAGLKFGGFSMEMPLKLWINDALMAIFFFTVGMEIKREMLYGQLSSVRKSALPIVAAIGGMLVPAAIYFGFNSGHPESVNGWGIPMATDIAFAIGILSLLGSRVPASLKIFLTALAIVDDLGAIIVLAVFYPTHALHLEYLVYVGVIMGILVLFNSARLKNKYLYLIPGVIMWYFTYKSGIHATIAGVLLAMTIPSKRNVDAISRREIPSLLHKLEQKLHPAVTYIIMPLFALANAGVAINFGNLAENGLSAVSLGIFFGLLAGKPAGIFLFSFLSIKLKLAARPEGVTWMQLASIGILGGIGFTMSIFINNLAFSSPELMDIGKISILITSATAALLGLAAMSATCKRDIHRKAVK